MSLRAALAAKREFIRRKVEGGVPSGEDSASPGPPLLLSGRYYGLWELESPGRWGIEAQGGEVFC